MKKIVLSVFTLFFYFNSFSQSKISNYFIFIDSALYDIEEKYENLTLNDSDFYTENSMFFTEKYFSIFRSTKRFYATVQILKGDTQNTIMPIPFGYESILRNGQITELQIIDTIMKYQAEITVAYSSLKSTNGYLNKIHIIEIGMASYKTWICFNILYKKLTKSKIHSSPEPKATFETKNANTILVTGVHLEQDIIADIIGLDKTPFENRDQNYTMGVAFTFPIKKGDSSFYFFPVKTLKKFLTPPLLKKEDTTNLPATFSISIGNTSFTPEYLGNNTTDSLYFIVNDRPFASLFYLETKINTIRNYSIYSSSFVYGVLGTDLSNKVQTYIHKNHWFGSKRPIPYGWENQISKSGNPTFLFSYSHEKLQTTKALKNNNCYTLFQSTTKYQYNLGYYTEIILSNNFKFGLIDPLNWMFNNLSSTANQSELLPTNNRNDLKLELYLFSHVQTNFVLYNALLQGQFSNDFHTFKFSEINHFVLKGDFGIAMTVPINCKKTYAMNLALMMSGRSREFNTVLSRNHYWGSIQLNLLKRQ